MSTYTQEDEKKKRKKLILLLLLLLLVVAVIVGIVSFLRDSGEASATTGDLSSSDFAHVNEADVNREALKQAIADANALVRMDYTEESWNALVEALTSGTNVDGNTTATQDQVNNAAQAIRNMIAGLQTTRPSTGVASNTGSSTSNSQSITQPGTQDLVAPAAVDTTKPELTVAMSVLAGTTAIEGDVITLSFEASEKITAPTTVKIAGVDVIATLVEGANNVWTATYTVKAGDNMTKVSYEISGYADMATSPNAGDVVSGSVGIIVDTVDPAISVVYTDYTAIADGEFITEDTVYIKVEDDNLAKVEINGVEYPTNLDYCFFTYIFPADGEYTITATDKAGRTSEFTVTVDTVDPVISMSFTDYTAIADGEYITEKTVYIKVDDVNLAKVEVNGVEQSVDLDYCYFTYIFPVDGEYTITATDKAGRTSEFTVTVDREDPVIKINGATPVKYYNASVPSVTVTAEDDNFLSLVVNKIGMLIPVANPITDEGEYIAIALDKAGNMDMVNFIIDKTPTTVAVTSHVENEMVNGSITLEGTFSDNNYPISNAVIGLFEEDGNTPVDTSKWWLGRVDNAMAAGTVTSSVVDTTKLAEGKYVVKINSTDAAGNWSSDKVTIIVNRTPAIVTVTSHVDNEMVKGSITLEGTFSDDNYPIKSATIGLYEENGTTPVDGKWWLGGVYNATAAGTVTSSVVDTTKLPDGKYVVRLDATDGNGNWSSDRVTIIVDRTPATVTVTSHINDQMVNGNITLEGTFSDANYPIKTASIGLYEENGTTPVDGKWWLGRVDNAMAAGTVTSSVVDTTKLPDGKYVVRLDVTDGNGNWSSDRVTIIVNRIKPTAAITSHVENEVVNGSITLEGTFNDDLYPIKSATIGLFKADGSTPIDSSKWWLGRVDNATAAGTVTSSVVNTNNLAAGKYVVRLDVTDGNGNWNNAKVTIIVEDYKATLQKRHLEYIEPITIKEGVAQGAGFQWYAVTLNRDIDITKLSTSFAYGTDPSNLTETSFSKAASWSVNLYDNASVADSAVTVSSKFTADRYGIGNFVPKGTLIVHQENDVAKNIPGDVRFTDLTAAVEALGTGEFIYVNTVLKYDFNGTVISMSLDNLAKYTKLSDGRIEMEIQ